MPVQLTKPQKETLQRNLRSAIAKMAVAIDRGELRPTRIELLALKQVCIDCQLDAEAERIRRWLGRA